MNINSQKEIKISWQPPPERFSSFSPSAPRGSVRGTEQTRKQILSEAEGVLEGICR